MAGSRSIAAVLAFAIVSMATAVHADDLVRPQPDSTSLRRPRLLLGVRNMPDVSGDLLAEAGRWVTSIYAKAGIDVIWYESDEPPSTGALTVLLIITTGEPLATGVPPRALGIAIESTTGCGRVAYALWHRIAAFAHAERRSPGLVLGHVIAHEIGHLLLPAPSHGPAGLMSGHWRPDDLDDAERDRMRFTPRQAQTMRHRLAAEVSRVAGR